MKTTDEYLSQQPAGIREKLEYIRHIVKKTVPEAEEIISYKMPAFRYHGILLWYAAFKDHYSVFIKPEILAEFKKELKHYNITKSAIRIPFNEMVDEKLLIDILTFAASQNLLKDKIKLSTRTL